MTRIGPWAAAVGLAVAATLLAPGAASAAGRNYAARFTTLDPRDWDIYDSVGHNGNGRRRPSQVTVSDGILTITGTADGTTGGMKWRNRSKQYGQWDILMRVPAGCACYHPVVLLWGVDGGSGVDNPHGEIDIVEAWHRPHRDRNTFTLHYGDGHETVEGDVAVDMTRWHIYHLVWQESYLYTWIDDNPAYYTVDDVKLLPTGPMDLAIQLDWFPEEGTAGGRTASMQVAVIQEWSDPVIP